MNNDPSLTTVEILGGAIGDSTGVANMYGGNVYGSSRGKISSPTDPDLNTMASVKEAVVNIGGGLVNASVYGSGENGHVNTNATINISGGRIGDNAKQSSNDDCGNVFGAGSGTDTYTEGGVEKYNPLAGIVKGNTTINLSGGWVMRSIYGGGEMASVGTIQNDSV